MDKDIIEDEQEAKKLFLDIDQIMENGIFDQMCEKHMCFKTLKEVIDLSIKELRKQENKRNYEKHKEKILEQQRLYRAANPEVMRERYEKYRDSNKEKISAQKRTYYERNRESILAKRKDRYARKKLDKPKEEEKDENLMFDFK